MSSAGPGGGGVGGAGGGAGAGVGSGASGGPGGGAGGGAGGGGAPPPPPPPPPIPPYVPPTNPAANPHAWSEPDPVYFSCLRCLFNAGSGSVPANATQLILPRCRPQVVLPDLSNANPVANAIAGVNDDDEEANTQAIRCLACGGGSTKKPCIMVSCRLSLPCDSLLTLIASENDDGRFVGLVTARAVGEGLLQRRSFVCPEPFGEVGDDQRGEDPFQGLQDGG